MNIFTISGSSLANIWYSFFNTLKGYFTDQSLPTNVNLPALANFCFQTPH